MSIKYFQNGSLTAKQTAHDKNSLAALTSTLDVFLSDRPDIADTYKHAREPKISIVIPSYNQGRYLEKSILSVINQRYPNIELIVIDGGSNDNSVNILQSYDSYISYWVSEPDRGQSDALNKGFSKASGDILGWLNSDDLYLPGVFSRVANEFRSHEDALVVYGDYLEIDKNDTVRKYVYSFDFNLRHFIYEGFHLNVQAMFWRQSIFREFGEFDVRLHRTMDYDMILRFGHIAGNHGFLRTNIPLACFRRHDEQKTRGMDEVVVREHAYIREKAGIKPAKINDRLWWYLFRIRRLYWYLKRGGATYLLDRMVFARLWK